MRPFLLVALPAAALLAGPTHAESLCAPIDLPPPAMAVSAGAAAASPSPARPAPASAPAPSPAPPLPEALAALPFVRHVAASGAAVRDLGEAHGMRAVAAVRGDEFMLFQVAPGGGAAVAGAIAHLSPAQLAEIAPGGTTEIGERLGLRGLFVRSGPNFQVFYVTPDGQRVIPGVLYDAAGREQTRAQIATIPGAVPTVVVGDGGAAAGPAGPVAATAAAGGLGLLERLRAGGGGPEARPRVHAEVVGAEGAPTVWMLADPRCGYSVRAMQMLQPLVSSGRVRVGIVPVAVLDREPGGASARKAMAMLSLPPGAALPAWGARALGGVPPAPDAPARLADNMALANAIRLTGTPTFLFRRADGSEGRADGLPDNPAAIAAAMGR